MTEITHRIVQTNGIRMHIASAGAGPLVVLLHGFPESWYSWRHQLRALAEAGFHAVAPDQRGYGQTDRPDDVREYTQLHLVGDVIGLLDALGEEQAVIVGHDWGAPVAWNSALMRPDRVRGVIGLSVPYRPRGPASSLQIIRKRLGDGFYQAYFEQHGVADRELWRDARATLRKVLYTLSGEGTYSFDPNDMLVPAGSGFLDVMREPPSLPDWLTEADLAFYAGEFGRTGFTGGLNWYRTIDLSWELMAPWQGAKVTPPALFMAGDRDLVVNFPGVRERLPELKASIPNLEPIVLLPGCGHWTQQERPADVNAALIAFLGKLGAL
jgi:pimeloyl-ACP methyl ester carboxylesterase